CCPIINPGMRYPDLMVQRQVIVHLLGEAPPHSREEMDTIRYRAQEELQDMASLHYRRERHLLLKHLSSAVGKTFPAVVLYLRRDGALVELVGYPLKTVVRPPAAVEIGEKIRVRLSGVDLWGGRAHFGVV
ncbi:MAG: hypothetical protein O7G87_01170, partial [bacterium]|nr:hypothetical protein [bacterium]